MSRCGGDGGRRLLGSLSGCRGSPTPRLRVDRHAGSGDTLVLGDLHRQGKQHCSQARWGREEVRGAAWGPLVSTPPVRLPWGAALRGLSLLMAPAHGPCALQGRAAGRRASGFLSSVQNRCQQPSIASWFPADEGQSGCKREWRWMGGVGCGEPLGAGSEEPHRWGSGVSSASDHSAAGGVGTCTTTSRTRGPRVWPHARSTRDVSSRHRVSRTQRQLQPLGSLTTLLLPPRAAPVRLLLLVIYGACHLALVCYPFTTWCKSLSPEGWCPLPTGLPPCSCSLCPGSRGPLPAPPACGEMQGLDEKNLAR